MSWLFWRRLGSAIRLAFLAVVRNKLRAGLTTLGITIGVASVVTVTALATAARTDVSAQVATLGSNALIVFPRSSRASGARTDLASRLSELDAKALVRESTSISAAVPFMRAVAVAVYEGQNASPSIIGTKLDYFEIRSWAIAEGTFWSRESEGLGDKVVVIGKDTAQQLFGTEDPIGRNVRLGRFNFRVLGVLAEKGNSPFGANQDEIILMPIQTMRSSIVNARPNETHAILFNATSAETTTRAQRQAEQILREQHRIRDGQEDDFMVRSQAEFRAVQEAIFGALTSLLIGIAAVSLIVGGIGVMNIMLVSVAERTREIGIRMAIGAREADIMTQFLVESLVLATLGGIMGALVGSATIFAFAAGLGWKMKLDPVSLAIAVGTSTTVGLVFGFLPARRAARLDPVLALGRE